MRMLGVGIGDARLSRAPAGQKCVASFIATAYDDLEKIRFLQKIPVIRNSQTAKRRSTQNEERL